MLIGLAAVVALFSVLWLASIIVKNSSIVDMWWGPGILAIAAAYKATTDGARRSDIVVALVAIWALRLAWHIGQRNIGHGEDFRYAKWRRERGPSWWWFSYFKVFLLQAVIAWIISMPLYYAIASPTPQAITYADAAAALVFVVGFVFEGIADHQLRVFRSHPANKGRVLDTGLWRYSRHPNYFGEAVIWWAFGLFGVITDHYVGLIGPAIMTFLLIRVSGVALLEKTLRDTKPEYTRYVENTSAFIPMPPKGRTAPHR